MMQDKLIVFHNGVAIVIIEPPNELATMNNVLDWYAEKYGFDRRKLNGTWLPTVRQTAETTP